MVKIKLLFVMLVVFSSTLFGVTDMLGRNVEIKSAKKLVFIGPGALRFGVYMGLEDRLVGIEKTEYKATKLVPYRQVLQKKNLLHLPIIGQGGPGKMPSMEALLSVKPDLIIASFVDKEQASLIEAKTKIPVFVVSYGSGYGGSLKKIESIKKSLLLIGKITEKNQRAKELTDWINKENKEFKKLSIDTTKKLYVGGIGYKGSWGITSTESDYLPFMLLGLKNALSSKKQGHLFLDLEKILEVNPDIILLDKGGAIKIKEEMKNSKAIFSHLQAFKNKKTYWVPPFNFYNTNVENCYFIAWKLAYILGADVDVEQKKKSVFETFFPKER